MKHEVNLYKREFWPHRLLVSCRQVLTLWLLTLTICGGVSWYFDNGVNSIDTSLTNLKVVNARLDDGIQNLSGVLANRSKDHKLGNENEKLKQQLKQRAELAAFLDGRHLANGNTAEMSGLMSGFARQAGDGIWLGNIFVNANNSELRLSGYVQSADQIPAYLQRLGNDPAFTGRFFRSLNVQTATFAGRVLLSFSLSSQPVDKDPETPVAPPTPPQLALSQR